MKLLSQAGDFVPETASERYLHAFMNEGSSKFIRNADVEVKAVQLSNHKLLPLIINNRPTGEKSNYIVSPYCQYISYAHEAIEKDPNFKSSFKRNMRWGYSFLGKLLKILNFDKVVFVNNWLVSTNLWDEFNPEHLSDCIRLLIDSFPNHAIVFRSVVPELNLDLYEGLKKRGAYPVVSRHIYLMNPEKGLHSKKRPFQQDKKFYENMKDFSWDNKLKPAEDELLAGYYYKLYLEKYSHFNPNYTGAFVRLINESELLRLHILRNSEKPVAVMGTFELNGVITTPFIGYDPEIPADAGLYRLMNMHLMLEAINKNLILNQSSGAGAFKKQRGGESAYEYNFIYTKHLNIHRKMPWRILEYLSYKYIIPGMEKYGV